jgi:hypothetical protein
MVVAAPTNAGGGEASRSPQAILSDMQRDLRKVESYHLVGRLTDPSGVTRLSGDVMASGAASFGLVHGQTALRMILLPRSTYLKANAAYWRASDKERGAMFASKLADRWIKVPESARGPFKPLLAKLSPKHLASCVFAGTGTMTNHGLTTLGGRKVIVLEGKADQPGATPGSVYIAADGPVLPVRQVQTGPRRAGGKLDKRCEAADDKTTAGDLTFSQYNRVPAIRAPRRAIVA